jgi:hypothetical protein
MHSATDRSNRVTPLIGQTRRDHVHSHRRRRDCGSHQRGPNHLFNLQAEPAGAAYTAGHCIRGQPKRSNASRWWRGAGTTPWRLNYAAFEEDIFVRAVSQPVSRRTLTVESCRILVQQFRDKTEAHQARAAALVGRSVAYAFDLHTLLPVPATILQRGPDARPTPNGHIPWNKDAPAQKCCPMPRDLPGSEIPAGSLHRCIARWLTIG